MDIRLIYTDADRVEQGYLRNFSADVDVAKDKDFEITVARDNNILRGGSWWYISNTEYGGIVDNVGVVTADREIRYTGRNLRGILCDKIIEPPQDKDYNIVSGDAIAVINSLIEDAGLSNIYRMTGESWNVQSFQFNRYVSLYDGICALLSTQNRVLRLVIKDGYVTMSSAVPYDYTEDKDCMRSDINYNITQVKNGYNHLICLGQGELKDRQVLHLYVDKMGNITDTQTYKGLEERTAIYDYSSASSIGELRTGGIARLQELNADSLDMTLPDMSMQIGDITGGTEKITGATVRKQITNIIAKIDDNSIDIEYSVS
ncbi:hypothetical protein [Coprococcus aceti]|jgi:hypothetical protein|uniref:hypothetical protein n=1 Tax=Coprococcus aceti TaxID=2981786 RepID=UPI0020560D47|nr:hypothetical protein [Coprococcus aceti]DAV92609.1 MAG TPA: hypothetical protein [Caudoviricetes sp.]